MIRPSLSADPIAGTLYLTMNDAIDSFSGPDLVSITFWRSPDAGITWSQPLVLSSTTSSGARAVAGVDGAVYVIWEDIGAGRIVGRKSLDYGATFGPEFTVAPVLDNMNAPPPGWRSSRYWSSPVSTRGRSYGHAFPSVAVDRSGGPRHGTLYVAFSESAAGVAQPVTSSYFEQEPNEDETQATVFPVGSEIWGYSPNSDSWPPNFDYLAFDGTAGTTVQITGDYYTNYPFEVLGLTLFHCGEDTTGEFGRDRLLYVSALDHEHPAIFTLPYTGRYIMRPPTDGNGGTYRVALQHYTLDPGQAALDHRDVVIVSSSDGGATWSAKRRVNDDPPHLDNAFPELAVDGFGNLHAAWYDRRDDPHCGTGVNTYWTMSSDGGVTFRPSRRLSSGTSKWDDEQDRHLGDYLGLHASGNRVIAMWADDRVIDQFKNELYATRILVDDATPVLVQRFDVQQTEGAVVLAWTVADAGRVSRFEAQRAVVGGAFETLPGGNVTVNGSESYSLQDETAEPGRSYAYRLIVHLVGGESVEEGPITLRIPAAITALRWAQPRPNPFSRDVALSLEAPKSGQAIVRIYDIEGNVVRTLHDGAIEAGVVPLSWDGRAHSGARARPGIYLVRADLGGEVATHRLVRVQ